MDTAQPPGRLSRGADVAAELAQAPDAAFWAEACGWVPGTGHCRNCDCTASCLFASQRTAEHGHVARRRRSRRRASAQSR